VASRGLSIEVDGLMETIRAVNGLERELERPAANKELRAAARSCAAVLVVELARAAASSGVPVARKVARSLRVKTDRLPVVAIAGPGILWGSEHGPKSSPNRFAVGPNLAGYWITPTVDRFASSGAIVAYRRAVYEVLHRSGLI